MKRLFDVVLSGVLLLLTAPLLTAVALLIRLDSPGPVLYAQPTVGKGGRPFGLWRFRTVDPGAPAYWSMDERLTRVGRAIRERSLDDLPNLFNVLAGDLSLIGPRPTEPERVDLSDPVWREILTVTPGLLSPAILVLARSYNASPLSVKQQIELAYVRRHSLRHDLDLFRQGVRGFWRSRGNWKARGTPSVELQYAAYRPQTDFPTADEQPPPLSAWNVVEGAALNLSYVEAYVRVHGPGWEPHRPQVGLVPCAGGEQKPALFLTVTHGFEQWARHVRWRAMLWTVVAGSRYIGLGCSLFFEDVTGAALGLRTVEGTPMAASHGQRLACSAVLDVASAEVDAWFAAWRRLTGDLPLFVVAGDGVRIHHRYLSHPPPGVPGPDPRAQALETWQQVKVRLQQSNQALENFEYERAFLLNTLPHGVPWESVETVLGTHRRPL